MSDAIVELDNVRKYFKTSAAVDGISFEIRPGEILGFVGHNGCGKTTTVRLMLGFYRAQQGLVRVLGHDPVVEFERVGFQIGVMFDQPGVLEDLTAEEYLRYFAALLRVSNLDISRRVEGLLNMIGLSDRRKSLIKTFSKGMRQRVSLARCLLNDPRFIILDEPFDGLDYETRGKISGTLQNLKREKGTAVFVTSHNLAEIEAISDRVAIVQRGQIVAIDKLEALRSRLQKHRKLIIHLASEYPEELINKVLPVAEYKQKLRCVILELDSTGGNLDAILMQLLKSGISILSVERPIASLEDVCTELTRTKKGTKV